MIRFVHLDPDPDPGVKQPTDPGSGSATLGIIPLLLPFREALERIFTKYGPVTGVVVNEKKGGSALVEFADTASARMAANIETGFMDNPFKVKPLFEDGLPQSANSASHLNKSKHFN